MLWSLESVVEMLLYLANYVAAGERRDSCLSRKRVHGLGVERERMRRRGNHQMRLTSGGREHTVSRQPQSSKAPKSTSKEGELTSAVDDCSGSRARVISRFSPGALGHEF